MINDNSKKEMFAQSDEALKKQSNEVKQKKEQKKKLLDKYQRLNENMKNIDYYAEFGNFW